ncbi:unnamed protein product, partial [Ectocarpus fasciculatus]
MPTDVAKCSNDTSSLSSGPVLCRPSHMYRLHIPTELVFLLFQVPLGPYPNHLTEDKCLKLHDIYRDAVNHTEELESIVASKLSALKRKRSQSGSTIQNSTANAVGWDQPAGGAAEGRNTPGGGGGGGGGGGKDKQVLSQQQQQQLPKKKKKKDKARTADGGGGGGGGGDGQPPKKRKGNSGKDSKR